MMGDLVLKYDYDMTTKLNNFEKYIRRQTLSRFLSRYELFKKIIEVKGSIIECGVHHGGGLMAWAKLSSAFEPYAILRKVIGFDTFEGFPSVSDNDNPSQETENEQLKKGGLSAGSEILDELKDCISEYDANRFLSQFRKVELVKGDAVKTIPEYIAKNQHLVVALLFLDFDLYEPTKAALDAFLTRIPKGGIVAFDEINNQFWPGETKAMMGKLLNLNNYQIKKFPFDPNISYIVL